MYNVYRKISATMNPTITSAVIKKPVHLLAGYRLLLVVLGEGGSADRHRDRVPHHMTDEQRVQQDGYLCKKEGGRGGGRGEGGEEGGRGPGEEGGKMEIQSRERERGGGGREQRTGVYSRRKRCVQVRSFVCFEVT